MQKNGTAPIKDIKTLIYAFYNLQSRADSAELYIMGGTDDETYRAECVELAQRLNADSIHILGYVDAVEYMEKMDFTVMTSISEGQPLAILESLAAGRPCIATNVGNCACLLQRPTDGLGKAGICCNPMDIKAISDAMEKLCVDYDLRVRLGENGKKRVLANYTYKKMNDGYLRIYGEVL